MKQDNDENALSRWSRRKLEARRARLQQPVEVKPQAQDGLSLPAVEEPAPVLTDADMPAIDTLTQDSDYSGFMSSGVSERLRKLALRKLFQHPSFNIVDGLDDYDEDYTEFAALGDIVTCDMKHRIEMEELEKEAQRLETEAAQQPVEQAGEQPPDELEQAQIEADAAQPDRAIDSDAEESKVAQLDTRPDENKPEHE